MKLYSKLLLIGCLVFFFQENVSAQKKNIWKTLGLMKFERQFSESDGISQNTGTESRYIPIIKALEGQEIEVKGYIIPLTGKKAQSHFMFSAYPFANCFFCGNAGPETVMEVYMKEDKQVEYSDNALTLKGKFKFLGVKTNDVMFQLEEGDVVIDKG